MTVDEFIEEWGKSGGNERANTQTFINDLCELIGVARPKATQQDMALNDYVFERNVVKTEIDGTTSNGWIDCYKKDCFILEAKQGSDRDREAVDAGQGDSLKDFFGQTAAERFKRGMARRGTGQWTAAMQKAAGQAEGYAKALPKEHGWPPFLLVSDIGYCIDIYADFSRSGKGYAPFPDRRRFRIELENLRNEKVRERLKAIWENPMSLDPSAEAARVTRDIAEHLATVARRLEAREQNPDRVAHFLMRLLFTMFAEDTGLIPKKSFSALLKKVRDRPENLVPALSDLWAKMDKGGFVGALGEAGETVRRFNGYLFKETTAIPLETEEIEVLIAAAASDWRQVEPAIFGTLLERALNPKERAKLGAHYTPRAYVERLVEPTIMEPLKEDWLGARTAAAEAAEAGGKEKARKIVEAFHGRLARTTVLDPACGTGNFLYVSMARMKELEGEALELLEELGDRQYLAEISGHTITPENFLGIEINPRAAAIAQLVLWIGYLQWHFKVNGEERMPEPPVLRDVKTIECRDALIDYDRKELERDERGQPVTRWDGETMKPHPVTGKPVPDETARVEVYRYVNPRAAKWPKADFIIGNPPFIGSKMMRLQLDDGYVDAIQAAHPEIPKASDFVLRWFDIAARKAGSGQVRRGGFIMPNTVRQKYNRRIIEKRLTDPRCPVSFTAVIADHPWPEGVGVRVSLATFASGFHEGRLQEKLERDSVIYGQIAADFSIELTSADAAELRSNWNLCCVGVKTIGKPKKQAGGDPFIISEQSKQELSSGDQAVDSQIFGPLANARTVDGRKRQVEYVIDTHGISERRLQTIAPRLYAYLDARVRPFRVHNKNPDFAERWWIMGHPRDQMREAIAALDRYIVTSETGTQRFFQFIDKTPLPDSSLVTIALSDGFYLAVLSSRIHEIWIKASGGKRIGCPRYNKRSCFDNFPFPDTSDEALKQRIRDAAEKLDGLRKQVLERHPDLTLTKIYNTLEALRAAEASGGTLSDKERDIAERGCVSLIRQYHDEIDAAVTEAYGWGDLLRIPLPFRGGGEPRERRRGGGAEASSTAPPPAPPLKGRGGGETRAPTRQSRPSTGSGRTVWVEGADEIILERLVALNKERAAEEARGKVRWLRPEFQAPGYVAPAEQEKLALPEEKAKTADVIDWPAKLPEQVVAVAGVVERAGRPVAANDVARAFKGKRAGTIVPVLDALAGMGRLRKLEDGRFAA